MILASVDVESTGLDVVNDRVIEFGGVLFSTSQHKCLDNIGVLVKTDTVITPEITKITGIHPAAVERFGYESDAILDVAIEMINAADAVIGYNVRRFDFKIMTSWANRAGRELPVKPWIDLFQDLPWDVPVGKLSHTACDHGILNLFPHSALSDAQTVLAIASKYDPQLLLDRSQSSVVILRSQADRSQNELVKRARFRWNPQVKVWWKPIKQIDVDEVMQQFQFPVVIDKTLDLEMLDN